jgi:hypothetical protein
LKACDSLEDLNEIFTLANTYLKPPKVGTGNGFGIAFATSKGKSNKTG